MTVLFQEGCDLYGTDESLAEVAGWSRADTNSRWESSLGRFGGGCMTLQYNSNWWQYALSTPPTTVFVHHSRYFIGAEAFQSTYGLFTLYNATGAQVARVDINDLTQRIELRDRSNTLQATSAWALTASQWFSFQVKVVVHATTGSITAYHEGVEVVTATNINTEPSSGDASVGLLRFGGVVHGTGNGNRIDDIVVWDDQGSDLNDLTVGKDLRIDTLRPNADTAQEDFTPLGAGDQYVEVDEDPSHDGDTSYNESTGSGDVDRLGLGTITGTVDTIYNVRTRMVAKKTDAAAETTKLGVYSGSTPGVSAAQGLSTSYGYHHHDEPINPDDSAAWEKADIDALQVQYEHV